jgi:divalent metal cation (Fe/Co/Zn/Cd) transporter
MDGVDPEIIRVAEAEAAQTPGVQHAHARARWTGRTLRVEVEGWIDSNTTIADSDTIGRDVATRIGHALPDVRNFTWTTRGI